MALKKTLSSTTAPKRPRAATATATTTPARPRARRQAKMPVTAEQIRERAYFLSLERNGGPADPDADWARAERELAGGTSRK